MRESKTDHLLGQLNNSIFKLEIRDAELIHELQSEIRDLIKRFGLWMDDTKYLDGILRTAIALSDSLYEKDRTIKRLRKSSHKGSGRVWRVEKEQSHHGSVINKIGMKGNRIWKVSGGIPEGGKRR